MSLWDLNYLKKLTLGQAGQESGGVTIPMYGVTITMFKRHIDEALRDTV